MQKDIRFIQRYTHFTQAFAKLREVVLIPELNEIEQNGMVQRFEFTLELAWKTMRDFLTEEGFIVWSPKETMRQAFASGYIDDAQVWMDMIDLRNAFSHDYDGTLFDERESFLRKDTFLAIEQTIQFFSSKIWK